MVLCHHNRLTVPPQYYAYTLRKYTEKLVFIPFKDTGEFGEKDGPDLYNLKHYAAAPGVIYADEVIVQSENIRNHYVNLLMNLVEESLEAKNKGYNELSLVENDLTKTEIGSDRLHRDIWQSKIRVRMNQIDYVENIDRKRIIYCIGANELSEHGDILINTVINRFDTFKENKDRIKTTITLYPDDKQQWTNVNPELAEKIFDLIDREVSEGTFDKLKLIPKEADDTAMDFDAYYGDSSPLVPAFVMQKKPVMIANYERQTKTGQKGL